jgi:hypothetical protein
MSSGAGIIGQIVADVPSGLSLTPAEEKKTTPPKIFASYQSHVRSTYMLAETVVLGLDLYIVPRIQYPSIL